MKDWIDFGIVAVGIGPEIYTTCPQCSAHRKKPNAKCLSANLEKGVWVCHHCGWAGSLKQGEDRKSRPFDWRPPVYRRPSFTAGDPTEQLVEWFATRGISREIVVEHGIKFDVCYFPQLEERVAAIVFPYRRKGEVVNCKYRALNNTPDGKKVFRQEFDAEKILYGVDDMNLERVVIVEGELDKLACAVAGVRSCVSVPDGAPPEHSKPSEKKFEYLVNCEGYLAPVKKFVLAVDGDGPGKALEQELARRLGQERCWRVQWPEDCKDANDVLLKHGTAVLRDLLDQAKPWPLDHLIFPVDIAEDVLELQRRAIPRGVSTGWATLDPHYTVMTGELTVVTGIPGHGKSEFLDALLVNLAYVHGWAFTLCSPENLPVTRHVSKLVEKYCGGPFYDRGSAARLTQNEVVEGLEFLNQHFSFIASDESLTIEALIQKARALVFRCGIKGLVLDPWNEFDHRRAPGLSETEHVSASLGLLRRFARQHGVHVWVVAHPAKLQRTEENTYPVPRPYDISGSAHWYNRADNCLSVWRDTANPDRKDVTEIHVQKIRSKYVGTVGMVSLKWNALCGRFAMIDEVPT